MAQSESPHHLPVYAAAACAITLWAGTAIANKFAIVSIDSVTAGVLRALLAGPVAYFLAKALKLSFPSGSGNRILLLVSSTSSFIVWPLLMSYGLSLTTANHAAVIMVMIPVFTGLFAAAVDRVWPRTRWWLGIAVACLGTFLLIFYRSSPIAPVGTPTIVGDLVVLAGVLSCAVGYVAGGKLSLIVGTWATTFWGLSIATIIALPVTAALFDRTDWSEVGLDSWLALAYMTLFSSILGYAAWFWALGKGGIARIGSWQLTMPFMTILLSWLLLDEAITGVLLISGIIVVAGTGLAQSAPQRRQKESAAPESKPAVERT